MQRTRRVRDYLYDAVRKVKGAQGERIVVRVSLRGASNLAERAGSVPGGSSACMIGTLEIRGGPSNG